MAFFTHQALHSRAFKRLSMVAAVLSGLLGFAMADAATSAPVFPLSKSANGRYLVDAAGQPFLLVGDSAWSLLVNLNLSDITTFLQSRSTNGFNAVLASLVSVGYTGGRTNASLLDGTLPFTNIAKGQFDLAAVNPAYFASVSNAIRVAYTKGILMILDPLETGGFIPCALTNGPARCLAYGRFLGKYFKGFSNIMWMSGNDYNYDNPNIAAHDACLTNIAWGIKTTAPNQLQSVEVSSQVAPSDGMMNTNWWPLMDLCLPYTWGETYDMVLKAYHRANYRQVIFGEGHYEEEAMGWPPAYNNTEPGTPLVIRKQIYWTMTSGGCGHLYGHHATWTFPAGWQSALVTPAVRQLGYSTAFFGARKWWLLVPDSNHSILTRGYGTYSSLGLVSTNDYATAARTTDGALIVAYVPATQTITVDMAKLSGAATAQWFDPANGTYTQIPGSPLSNRGLRNFTPPGHNSSGEGDWVLVVGNSNRDDQLGSTNRDPQTVCFNSLGPHTPGY